MFSMMFLFALSNSTLAYSLMVDVLLSIGVSMSFIHICVSDITNSGCSQAVSQAPYISLFSISGIKKKRTGITECHRTAISRNQIYCLFSITIVESNTRIYNCKKSSNTYFNEHSSMHQLNILKVMEQKYENLLSPWFITINTFQNESAWKYSF